MHDETIKRIHHLHNIVLVLMMNLDDVDERVKESIVSMAGSIVSIIEEFINEGDDSVPSAEIKKLQRVSKKMKSIFSLFFVC